MKKTISIILTLVLILSMSMTAFAAEVPDSESQPIKATYSEAKAGTKYQVDIKWGDMEFNYNSGMEEVWDPETLKFKTVQTGDPSWTPAADGGDVVTVTNHSNTGLLVTVTYTPAAENGVAGTVENNSFLLATAEGTAYDDAPKDSAKLALDKTSVPASWSTEGATTIGSLTVELDYCISLVSSEEELETAIANGGTVVLTKDITLSNNFSVSGDATINLNGYTLTPFSWGLSPAKGYTLTLKGEGTVAGEVYASAGIVHISGGRVEKITCEGGAVTFSGGHVEGEFICYSGTVHITGGHVGAIRSAGGAVTITGGTFGSDPRDFLVEGYTATYSETDGIWTVTAK